MSSWVSLALLLALSLQALLVSIFYLQVKWRRVDRLNWKKSPVGGWPPVEIILCLRGADESLREMLESVAGQKYLGKWRFQIVVDSFNDPSWRIVEEFAESQSQSDCLKPTWQEIRLQTLLNRPLRGSLKCASLLQAFNQLNPESEVIAVVDADAVVSPNWLSDLVLACCQPGIGAVSGNRWFVPGQFTLMGWTRSVWNAGALVLMTLFAIPWGGSLAVRREVIEAGDWKKLLGCGLCEDTGLLGPLRKLGLRYVFRPELLVVNRQDDISLFQLVKWIARQLLTARLHHPAWPLVVMHGLGTFLLLLAAIVQGAWPAVVTYELGCLVLLVCIEVIALQRRPMSLWGWILALLPGQLIDGLATVLAVVAREVEWSEVVYKVTSKPRGVTLIGSPKLFDEVGPSNPSCLPQND